MNVNWLNFMTFIIEMKGTSRKTWLDTLLYCLELPYYENIYFRK